MIEGSFPAMGTTVDVFADDSAGIDRTRQLFEEIEERASRFRESSELSAINRRRGFTVSLSPMMAEILAVAADLRDRTKGIVDPAVGGRVVDWGYDRTFEEVRGIDAEPDDRAIGSWAIDGTTLCRYPGVSLDLGGIAKGWACDQAVESRLALVVSAGGDVRSSDPDTLAEILDGDDAVAATVQVGRGALATSSTLRRRWNAAGKTAHHIIDPRTGAPAKSPILSATAMAATAVEAEAGAKAALILGVEGLAWMDGRSWLRGGLAIWQDGSVFATGSAAVAA